MTRKQFIMVFVLIMVCTLFYYAHTADQARHSPTANGPTSPVLGTWETTEGSVFQFRPDGTGRSYTPSATVPTVHYFEWNADASSLTMIYSPRGVIKGFLAKKLGVETVKLSLTQGNSDSFTLTDVPSSSSTLFRQTHDSVLDAAW